MAGVRGRHGREWPDLDNGGARGVVTDVRSGRVAAAPGANVGYMRRDLAEIDVGWRWAREQPG